MLYEPAGLSLHFLFIYTRSFVAPDFLKTSRHTTQAEIRTAPYRKAYLQVSRELGLNYRTASDEDLETYLHNDPDAVRDAMRILEENHLNIFR